jgi:3-oxoacyl-ACP reductase-like protein
MGERRSACRVLVGKPEVKRPFGRSRSRWQYNIKMDLQEVGCGAWTGLIWLRIRTGEEHL